jgi:DNA-binding CsgD family transcriptional regulator
MKFAAGGQGWMNVRGDEQRRGDQQRRNKRRPDFYGSLVRPPRGLTVTQVSVGDDEFAILSFPSPPLAIDMLLTPAERAVLCSLLEGKSNRAIARERSTSVRTIANQVASIYRKAGVSSRCELAARCSGLAFDRGEARRS